VGEMSLCLPGLAPCGSDDLMYELTDSPGSAPVDPLCKCEIGLELTASVIAPPEPNRSTGLVDMFILGGLTDRCMRRRVRADYREVFLGRSVSDSQANTSNGRDLEAARPPLRCRIFTTRWGRRMSAQVCLLCAGCCVSGG
jgi:hypothetical protein